MMVSKLAYLQVGLTSNQENAGGACIWAIAYSYSTLVHTYQCVLQGPLIELLLFRLLGIIHDRYVQHDYYNSQESFHP